MLIRLSYSEDCWNEDGDLVDPWNDDTVDPRTVAQTVVVYADPAEAEEDQSIDGSSWEIPGDMDCAYTVLTDFDGKLADRLRADGYTVHEQEDTYPVDREDVLPGGEA